MCGISLAYNDKSAIRNVGKILIAQEIRGRDATGVAFINSKGDIQIIKRAETPTEFAEKLPRNRSTICVGHNRTASSNIPEKHRDKEAHPFITEDSQVAICHNGSVQGDTILRGFMTEILGHEFSSGVDSEVYLHMLEELLKKSRNRLVAIYKLFHFVTGNLLILFKDKEVYGIPNTDRFFVVMRNNSAYIASNLSSISEIYKKDDELTIFQAKSTLSESLLKIYMEDESVKIDLYGEWDSYEKPKGFKPVKEATCDICHTRRYCEEVKYKKNKRTYDRCTDCFKENKTLTGDTVDTEDDMSYKARMYGGGVRSYVPSQLRQNRVSRHTTLSPAIEIKTKVVCKGYEHFVSFDKTIYCTQCKKLFCKGCFTDKTKHDCAKKEDIKIDDLGEVV